MVPIRAGVQNMSAHSGLRRAIAIWAVASVLDPFVAATEGKRSLILSALVVSCSRGRGLVSLATLPWVMRPSFSQGTTNLVPDRGADRESCSSRLGCLPVIRAWLWGCLGTYSRVLL